MTWIYDDSGRRWVEPTPRKRRKPPAPRRFADLKVGDQLMQTSETHSLKRALSANEEWVKTAYQSSTAYFIVTDRWFDPVRGQDDPIAGQMVGYAQINARGGVSTHKSSMPIRGFASQRFEYADRDYIVWCKSRLEGMETGAVVGIGHGKVIRKRPKIPGGRL